ncbi:MAG: aminotransferase class I/II-fold pyridoxal phosphate-dependent enzyme [Planctomycetota bacterium]
MALKNIKAERLLKLPPYMFADFDHKRDLVKAKCNDLIDLSVGDPDIPPSARLKRYFCEALDEPNIHRYPPYKGTRQFCHAIAHWYKQKGIRINPDNEALCLLGSKEGLSHLVMALVNPGQAVLLPNPYFPSYLSAIIMSGGIPVDMPLLKENDFLPDLKAIKPSVARRAKLMLLNYPNNPTSADAPEEFYEEAVWFARKYGIVICQDAAYQEMYFKRPAASILSIKGAKDVAIETNSFSKIFNIAGWRIGWAAGNSSVIQALGQIKMNIDSGAFIAIQRAVSRMFLENTNATQKEIAQTRAAYKHRQDIMVRGLRQIGLDPVAPDGTCFIWLPLPKRWSANGGSPPEGVAPQGEPRLRRDARPNDGASGGNSSLEFCEYLLTKLHIHTTPGIGFGKYGEGYIRISLTSPESVLQQAIKRMAVLCPDENNGTSLSASHSVARSSRKWRCKGRA